MSDVVRSPACMGPGDPTESVIGTALVSPLGSGKSQKISVYAVAIRYNAKLELADEFGPLRLTRA
jgi:hypothetical protein